MLTVEVWTADGFEFPALHLTTADEAAARAVYGGCITFPGDTVTLTGGGVNERRIVTAETASGTL